MDDLFDSTTRPLADAVGNAISQAAPAHLVTHHGGGSSSCADYTSLLQAASWHDFHVFQSGHCLAFKRDLNPGEELTCDPRRNYNNPDLNEKKAACVTRRAQEMSFTLFSQATIKPSVQGEAVYDKSPAGVNTEVTENRQYTRHTAYLSALSGSFGFTYGANPVTEWNFVSPNTLTAALGPVPATLGTVPAATAHSAWDMQRMASIFKARPWKEFIPEAATRIKNQPTASESKMAYAHSTNYTFNLAYLPASSGDRILLDLSLLSPAFACGGTAWTTTWLRPDANISEPFEPTRCSGSGSSVELMKPSTCSSCELVLSIIRTGAKIDDSGDPVLNSLQVWPELMETGTAVRGQLRRSSGQKIEEPITLSQSSEEFFRKQPVVARDGGGSFFVVWESEYQDGSLFGVFGRRFDNRGRPMGDEVQVNTHTDHDQAEPWVSASPSGEAVVVWTSFDQDGDQGGIFGQLYDSKGRPEATEFQINTVSQGYQGAPRVDMDSRGAFVVAWESEIEAGKGIGIFAQRFDHRGLPVGEEFQVTPDGPGSRILADLRVNPNGRFEIIWYDYSLAGDLMGMSSRGFTAEGEPEE